MTKRALVCMGTLCLAVALPAWAAPASEPLFLDANTSVELPQDDPAVVRSREVRINFDAITTPDPTHPSKAHKKTRIDLNLFPDVNFTAVLDLQASEAESGFGWIGRLQNEKDSHVVLSSGGGVLMGTVALPRAAYRIRYIGGDIHVVEEIDRSLYPTEADPIEVPEVPFDQPEPDLLDSGNTFDLMVVYTPAARAAAGGVAAIQNLIAVGVAETNIAYANSQVPVRLNLVHTSEITYTEASDIGIDLDRLRLPNDGIMDSVHSLRNTYKADLVKLVGNSTAGGCGVAYLMSGSNNRAFESFAFSVTARTCISPNYTFGHELGHNMGSNHAPSDSGLGTGAFSYSFGYKNPSSIFRTVMAYDCPGGCPRLLYFSNPSVTYNGAVTGTTSQNNATSITNVRSIVANFRQAAAQTSCSGTSGQWSGCRGNGCNVCVEKVSSYPLYYFNHPSCSINYICGGQYFTCNSACPAPTSADQCNGTSGQWSGCRGNGCSVCEEKVADYPLYFFNHPACQRNEQCGGQYFTCNVNCPEPTAADRCDGTPGQWAGCRGNGCNVCAELVDEYKCYFKNHPKCSRNTTCGGLSFTCNENCPAPTEADRC